MKKIAFFMSMLSVVAMVSCQPTEPVEEEVKSVTISEHKVTLKGGGSIQLKAQTDPAGKQVTWSSSDKEVAAVNGAGNVAAIGEGKAWIYAQAGQAKDSCEVTVANDAVYSMFEIADYGLFGADWIDLGEKDTVLTLSDGDYTCVLKGINMYAWDSDVAYVDGKGWAGEGFFYDLGQVSLYVITKGEYAGYYVGAAAFQIDDLQGKHYHGCCEAGVVDPATYGEFVQAQYSQGELTPDFDKMFEHTTGALICLNEPDEESETGYMPSFYWGFNYGAIKNLILIPGEEDENGNIISENMYAAQLEWCNLTDSTRLYGFEVDMDKFAAEKKIELLTPYEEHYAIVKQTIDPWGIYEMDMEQAPAKMAKKSNALKLGNMSKLHREMPDAKHIKGIKKMDKFFTK